MNINTISYWIAEALAGIMKNQKTFLTGVATMVVSLFLVSLFSVAYGLADGLIDDIEARVGKIEVFQDYKTAYVNVRLLNEDASKITLIKSLIQQDEKVNYIEYINASDADVYSGEIPFASEGFLRVTIDDYRLADQTIEKIREIDGVSKGENDILVTTLEYDLMSSLYAINGVSNVEYISKEEAKIRAKETVPYGITKGVPEDIYPASYIVTVSELEMAEDVALQIRGIPGVGDEEDDVLVNKDANFLAKVSISAKVIAITVFIVSTVAACYMVMNTIKLIVYARKREITIMKYVGATDVFIKAPFVIEGLIMSLVSVAIVSMFVIGICNGCVSIATEIPALSAFASAAEFESTVMIIVLILGVSIGTVGSSMSLNKYLDV